MRVEPFCPAHFEQLQVQPHQARWKAGLAGTDWTTLRRLPNRAWSVLEGDRTLACVGLVDCGGGRARAWALLGEGLGRRMVGITRAIARGLAEQPYRRIDAEVAASFQPAGRWASMLGFQREGVMRAFCDNGADAELWARVRDDG